MNIRGGGLPEGRGWRATRSALYLSTGLGYDDWVRVGRNVTTVADSAAWWMGDWLIFGCQSYGQRYQTAVASTVFDYQTLRNYAWVASRFPVSRRRDTLSFGHHAELAALSEGDQEVWLDRCEAERWPRSTLRRCRRLARQGGTAVDPHGTGVAEPTTIALAVQIERHHSWQAAAHVTGMPLLAWIETALDNAAMDTLRDRGEDGFTHKRPESAPTISSSRQ